MMTERQLKEKIDDLEEELKVLKNVLETRPKTRMGRPSESYEYSEEKINFLTENKEMDSVSLIIKYNEKFSTDIPRTSRAIYNFMIRCGIIEVGYKKKKYVPRFPDGIEKSIKTKEKKFLKEVGINEDSKD